jgi:hypothetical protein
MRLLTSLCATGLCFAVGLMEAQAAGMAAPNSTAIERAAHDKLDHAIQDLGLWNAPPNSDNSIPASASASTESSAEPIPELPTWTMMLVFFMGLGLAGFKKGRKDRLSPGLD